MIQRIVQQFQFQESCGNIDENMPTTSGHICQNFQTRFQKETVHLHCQSGLMFASPSQAGFIIDTFSDSSNKMSGCIQPPYRISACHSHNTRPHSSPPGFSPCHLTDSEIKLFGIGTLFHRMLKDSFMMQVLPAIPIRIHKYGFLSTRKESPQGQFHYFSLTAMQGYFVSLIGLRYPSICWYKGMTSLINVIQAFTFSTSFGRGVPHFSLMLTFASPVSTFIGMVVDFGKVVTTKGFSINTSSVASLSLW